MFLHIKRTDGRQGEFNEPNEELSVRKFAVSLYARAAAFAKMGNEVTVLEGKGDK